MIRVFIDGSAGTTGLRIRERLSVREDISLITLPPSLRKDPGARRDSINQSDVAFLCLPDAAAREAVGFVENENTVIIDTSTAHRTAEDFTYGMPELSGQRAKIRLSRRIANPGCHASGFIALVAPLIQQGLLPDTAPLSCFSLTGYSGGGKGMIAQYEDDKRDALLDAPRVYGLTQQHKHLAEMTTVCGLTTAPIFSPVVAPYYSGMLVSVSVFSHELTGSIDDIRACYRAYYQSGVIRYADDAEDGFLSASSMAGRDDMTVAAYGNGERITLVSRFDNLGKGASGAAIQNMNLVIGAEETAGLLLG